MEMTAQHEKILSSAKRERGCSMSLYTKAGKELEAAGLIEVKEVFTTGGNRDLRWFVKKGR